MTIGNLMMRLVIYGEPRTKKNSQKIIRVKRGGRSVPVPVPSSQYKDYANDFQRQITGDKKHRIERPVNVKCLYFMSTRRRVDLTNLLEATDDILVDAGVLSDDKCTIVAGHDGSYVFCDKKNPRVEIEISPIGWSWEGIK